PEFTPLAPPSDGAANRVDFGKAQLRFFVSEWSTAHNRFVEDRKASRLEHAPDLTCCWYRIDVVEESRTKDGVYSAGIDWYCCGIRMQQYHTIIHSIGGRTLASEVETLPGNIDRNNSCSQGCQNHRIQTVTTP